MDDLDQISATLDEALARAGEIVLRYYRQPLAFDVKADASPVTLADRAAEAAIRELLGERFPAHAIYGEEQGHSGGSGGTWVIDPIDGTKSFLLGNPLFGCLLAFVRGGRVEAGGLAMPALGETWIADRRGPTRLNGDAVRSSTCRELGAAALLTSSPDFFSATETMAFDAVCARVRYRRFGGDCYCYAMLAGGWCDLVIESSLYPFDYLALVPIVEQAGGVISDWQGRPLGLDSGPRVLAAATAELHREALAILSRVADDD
ncbi:MAG: inositol monophosphatase family protein [Gammaproteobacteria bacterium]|nr:inositol monophosphatase family protein [Gammaproteobacteria bacterium]